MPYPSQACSFHRVGATQVMCQRGATAVVTRGYEGNASLASPLSWPARCAAKMANVAACRAPRAQRPSSAQQTCRHVRRWHAACTAVAVHFSGNTFVGGSPPVGPRFQLGAFRLQAESRFASERVGGDFYAFEQRDSKRLIIVIGDVCGRGSEAARLLPRVLTRLEDLSHSAAGPGRLLEELNRRV